MKICYFGIYKPNLSRNKIYISGLKKKGVEVIECRDDGGRFSKYWNLWKKHRLIQDKYDAMVIGYPGHIIVPFAKLISRKPIIADLLGSFKDAQTHSHNSGAFRRLKDGIIDWMAVKFADAILLESEAQKEFFIKRFGHLDKFKVLYTGVDESIFYRQNIKNKNNDIKIVLFRGRLTPESGIFHILKSAELLKNRADIRFRIIGFHYRLGQKVKDFIREKNLINAELIYDYITDDSLREKLGEASISLGQFESSPRLDRTIPHKTFESMVMGLPFITAYSGAVGELLKDGESCIFVKRSDPVHLAGKIIFLADNPVFGEKLADNAREIYDKKCSMEVLTVKLFNIVKNQQS